METIRTGYCSPGATPRLEHDHLTASRVAKAEQCGPLCDPKLMHFSAEASKQMASSGKPRQRAPMGCEPEIHYANLGPDHPMGGVPQLVDVCGNDRLSETWPPAARLKLVGRRKERLACSLIQISVYYKTLLG